MEKERLENMIKGWVAGNFSPSMLKTNDFEFGVKHYRAGDSERRHYHKIATEITVIVSGEVEMNGQIHRTGDVILIRPGESTDFKALTDAVTAVVKHPGANDDKYFL